MKDLTIPLTGDDLIAIGNTVNEVTDRLRTLENGTAAAGLMDGVCDVVVDILRPDAFDADDIVGQVRYSPDGWWAFYPRAVSEVMRSGEIVEEGTVEVTYVIRVFDTEAGETVYDYVTNRDSDEFYDTIEEARAEAIRSLEY